MKQRQSMVHGPAIPPVWAALILAWLTFARTVRACDFCAVYAATEAQGTTGRGWFSGIAAQYTDFQTFQSGGHNAANPDAEYLNSLMSQVFLGYNLNSRSGLQLNLPLIYREYGRAGAHGSEVGIGDTLLIGNLRLYQKQAEELTFRWSALAGMKFPTGSSRHLDPAEPDFAAGIGGHDLALGSGSFDGLIGTDFLIRRRKWFLTAGTQYAIRSEGDFGYQFANDLSWVGGPGVYLMLEENYTLALQAILSGETKGQDRIHGAATDDTAETVAYLGPQMNFTWSSTFSAQWGVDVPLTVHSSGDQIVPTLRAHAAVMWRF